jgi:hypothetical protein
MEGPQFTKSQLRECRCDRNAWLNERDSKAGNRLGAATLLRIVRLPLRPLEHDLCANAIVGRQNPNPLVPITTLANKPAVNRARTAGLS